MKDSPNLDLLRSIAVALVVVSHLRQAFGGWPWESVYDFSTLGMLGVAIFFVHTSLVLMQSLQRSGGRAGPFILRRAFRIYPLAMVAVILAFGMNALIGKFDGTAFLANLLLVQNITGHASVPYPLWSLPYEVQMYLLLPALYAVTLLPRALNWIALILFGALALIAAMWLVGIDYRLVKYAPCFLPGVLAFALPARRTWSPLALPWFVLLVVVTVPFAVAAGVPQTAILWAVCAALGLVIPRCRELSSPVIAACAKTIAQHSYGVYLLHSHLIIIVFLGLGASSLAVQWTTFLLLLVALPHLAYKFIERPGIRLGKRVADAYSPRPGRSDDRRVIDPV